MIASNHYELKNIKTMLKYIEEKTFLAEVKNDTLHTGKHAILFYS